MIGDSYECPNKLYPNGSARIYINNRSHSVDEQLAQTLQDAGVDFMEMRSAKYSKIPRGRNRIYALCRISQPNGNTAIIVNMKRFVEETFDESYGYVMGELKKPNGFKGYKATRLFSVSITMAVDPPKFSAIALEHPPEFPLIQ